MRVLYPILHYPPVIGGLEQWGKNIAERQPDDVETVVVTGRVSGAPEFEEKGGVKIFRTSLFRLEDLSHSSVLYIATAAPLIFIRSFLLSGNINLFHCHGFLSAAMGWLLSAVTRKPFLGTEQSVGWAGSKLRGFIYKRAEVCIASSERVKKEFESIGVLKDKIKIIPNGVDLKLFSNVGYRKPHINSEFVILSVGRLEEVKGHKYLIEAFADIKKEIQNAKLILVGGGSLAEDLRFKIKDLRLEDSVEFAGEIAHDKLPEYYARADVFVMPSLSEGFGITAIEAMAVGLPVIATRVGSLLEIINDGGNGMLISAKSSQAISEAVIKIHNDKIFSQKLSDNAKISAKRFDWQRSADEVGIIYKNLLYG